MPMTDDELMEFLGIKRIAPEGRVKIMASITPAKRELYDRMANLETEVALWQEGISARSRRDDCLRMWPVSAEREER